jgi:predicted enzyme related to lactoylglutathione lyase
MAEKIKGIRQIAITVSNVEAALGFYRDILGLEFLFAPGEELAFVQSGGIRIMLTTPQGAGAVGANSIIYFQVTDIETTFAGFVGQGAESERPPQLAAEMPDHELWIGFLKDPDGNLVGVLEEKRPQATPAGPRA